LTRGLPEVDRSPTTRTRRWDAVILGGALPGLVAAARLGMRGARVLVLEEQGVLGACLRALSVPLIDQRRVEPDPLAFQVTLPDARLDVGEPGLAVDEWVAWGRARPDEARNLVRACSEAATAVRDAMLESPVVHAPRRLARAPRRPAERDGASPAPSPRELAATVAAAPPRLAALLAAQVRTLSNLGVAEPGPAARARLLGAPFEGGASLRGDAWLREVLRRRIESLYGEFRPVPSPFRLVSAGGQPGVAPDGNGESGELWVARAFVLNAPRAALAAAVAQDPAPEILAAPPILRRRLSIHLQVEREVLPVAMASRVITIGDESLPPEGTNLVSVRSFTPTGKGDAVDLVASVVVDAEDPGRAAREGEIAVRVTELMPFAEGRLTRIEEPNASWDDAGWLADPAPGEAWPAEAALRLPTRQPIYQLDRASVAGLGVEGDLLLGWRGGDAIAADLA
jgi:hypothetical protein